MKDNNYLNKKVIGYATNDIDSLSMYVTRKRYKEEVLKYGIKPMDMWYDKRQYGKVDNYGNPVIISESNLKQINNKSGKTIFAADFVVDAFHDLREYINRSIMMKKIVVEDGNFLIGFDAFRGWESVETSYYDNIKALYQIFTTFYLKSCRRDEKIKDFDSFLEQFFFFLRIHKEVPFSKVNFILSDKCSSFISGLMLEISEEIYSDDSLKMLKYVNDVNFDFYRKAAKKFGFLIDKYIPWRLIADVSSPKMQSYMNKYGLFYKPGKVVDLFDVYYYHVQEFDMDSLRKILIQYYNTYVSSFPYLRKISISGDKTIELKTTLRIPIEEGYDLTIHSGFFWLQYYFNLRIEESNLKWNEKKREKEIKKCLEIYKYVDKENALMYINKKTLV